MNAWLSVAGMYGYRDDIFDLMQIPAVADLKDRDRLIDDIQPIDRMDLIYNILYELGELPLVYVDAPFLKLQIGLWSRINFKNWTDLWETCLYKYNPIWNKDGKVMEQRERTGTGTESGSTTENRTDGETWNTTGKITDAGNTSDNRTVTTSGTDSRTGKITDAGTSSDNKTTTSSGTRNEENLHKVTGFDSDTLRDESSDSVTGSTSETVTETGSGTTGNVRDITDSGSASGSEETAATGTSENVRDILEGRQGTRTGSTTGSSTGQSTEEMNESYERIEQGNIGVTTTQAMIDEQREIVKMNMYREITESFKQRFCLLVY